LFRVRKMVARVHASSATWLIELCARAGRVLRRMISRGTSSGLCSSKVMRRPVIYRQLQHQPFGTIT